MGAPHPLLLPLLRGDDLPPDTAVTMEVVHSAEEHFVAALVDQAIDRHGPSVPDRVRARLTARTIAAEAENLDAEGALASITRTARDMDLGVATFKGAAIGQQFYSEPRRRPAVDVDIFIDPRSMHRLAEFEEALGNPSPDRAAIDWLVREGRVFQLIGSQNGVLVDLHRDPMSMLTLSRDEKERWARTVIVTLPDGTSVRTLDLEDTMIHTLLHLFRDNFGDLLHVNDARLLMDAGPDWDEVARRCAVNGWTDIVRFSAWFASTVLDRESPLPSRIARWRKTYIERVWRENALLRGHDSHSHSLRRQFALGFLLEGQMTDVVRSYRQRALPPREVLDHRFPDSTAPYPVALTQWRLSQRRQHSALRNATTVKGNETL